MKIGTLQSTKTEMVKEIHRVLTLTLGPPPSVDQEFSWSFVDKAGVARTVKTTPRAFAADIYSSSFRVTSSTIASMVSLVHDPRNKPMSLLSVDRLGNVVGGRGGSYYTSFLSFGLVTQPLPLS